MKKTDNNSISKQLNKLRRDKRFLWLGILFFVLVTFWILLSLFATTKTSSISPELQILAKPFVPRLESKVFDEILLKRFFSKEELSRFSIYILDKNNTGEESQLIDITTESDGLLKEQSMAEESATSPTPTPASSPTPAADPRSSNIDNILEAIEGDNKPQN